MKWGVVLPLSYYGGSVLVDYFYFNHLTNKYKNQYEVIDFDFNNDIIQD